MKVVFKYEGYRFYPGLERVRFPSPETFIVTKAAAAKVKKRQRDAFDVFVTAVDERGAGLAERWRRHQNDGVFVDANNALRDAIHDGDGVEKIQAVCSTTGHRLPDRGEVLEAFDFLCEN